MGYPQKKDSGTSTSEDQGEEGPVGQCRNAHGDDILCLPLCLSLFLLPSPSPYFYLSTLNLLLNETHTLDLTYWSHLHINSGREISHNGIITGGTGGLDKILGKKIFTERVVQALQQATEGSEIVIPGSVGKPCGCDTWGFRFRSEHSGAAIRGGLSDLRGLSQP